MNDACNFELYYTYCINKFHWCFKYNAKKIIWKKAEKAKILNTKHNAKVTKMEC